MRANATHAIALLVALGGCDLAEQPEEAEAPAPTYGEGLGTAENPIPRDGAIYAVRSRIDRQPDGSVPADAKAIASTLRAFSQKPGATMITIASGADVPELDQLYAALPGTLTAQLEGWMTAVLGEMKIGSGSVPAFAAAVAGYAETGLTRFSLDSTMSFVPTRASHNITGVAFDFDGIRVVVTIGGLKADVIAQEVPVTVAERGVITFGDHEFGLAFGEHVWHGINLASSNVFGFDVQASLDEKLDCSAFAQAVASKCSDGQCVGHQTLLDAICERSIDLLVSDLSARIVAFDSDVVHYTGGAAVLVDENRDGLANRIADGVWAPELVMGPAKGTFTASTEGR